MLTLTELATGKTSDINPYDIKKLKHLQNGGTEICFRNPSENPIVVAEPLSTVINQIAEWAIKNNIVNNKGDNKK